MNGFGCIDVHNFDRQVAGAGLAHLHQIVDELFQSLGLPGEDFQVGILLLGGVGLFH